MNRSVCLHAAGHNGFYSLAARTKMISPTYIVWLWLIPGRNPQSSTELTVSPLLKHVLNRYLEMTSCLQRGWRKYYDDDEDGYNVAMYRIILQQWKRGVPAFTDI